MKYISGTLGAFVALTMVIAAGAAHAKSPADGLTTSPAGIVAVEFLDTAFNHKDVDKAFENYIGKTYRQHNPKVPDGAQGSRDGLKGLLRKSPGISYEFKRVIVEGSMVVVHSHVRSGDGGDRLGKAVDIYRVQDGKLVEHWDVIQPVPATAANQNTMF